MSYFLCRSLLQRASLTSFVFALLTGPLSLTLQLFRVCGSSLSRLVTDERLTCQRVQVIKEETDIGGLVVHDPLKLTAKNASLARNHNKNRGALRAEAKGRRGHKFRERHVQERVSCAFGTGTFGDLPSTWRVRHKS